MRCFRQIFDKLDDKDPSPRRISGYGSANNGPYQKSYSIGYRNVGYNLRILLWRNKVKDHDCAQGKTASATDALEGSEHNAATCQSSGISNPIPFCSRSSPYSCVSVCAALQAAEKMMNVAVDSKKMGFRPKMSLNLAKIMMTAVSSGV